MESKDLLARPFICGSDYMLDISNTHMSSVFPHISTTSVNAEGSVPIQSYKKNTVKIFNGLERVTTIIKILSNCYFEGG